MESLNPLKPVAAFIEYTVKPLLDDARELLICVEERGFKKDDLKYLYQMMIFQVVLDFVKTIVVTGAICYTVLAYLHTVK